MTAKDYADGAKPGAGAVGDVLCRLADIPDRDSRAFTVALNGKAREIFAVRLADEVFAYVNVCPHRQMPLNWKPDVFLAYDKSRILCTMHAATFDIRQGHCVGGPCPGQSLESVPVVIEDGVVRLGACADWAMKP
ncbi:MAG: Rieske (2Fe-2S) protein [Proteobacteria bacterium]|nr:Rieske (2Fe-2S) protein [Pseudomonadota bacterium]